MPTKPGISSATATSRFPRANCWWSSFPAGRNSVLVYFSCEDCANEESRVVGAGGKIQKEKFSIGQYGFISLVYDTEGNTWIYASSEALTYVRTSVKVDSIQGDDAVLLVGPPAGTQVVSVGAEELFGAETEFEEE